MSPNQVDVPDCVLLDPLSDDALITNLLARFKRDQIYVSRPIDSPPRTPSRLGRPVARTRHYHTS